MHAYQMYYQLLLCNSTKTFRHQWRSLGNSSSIPSEREKMRDAKAFSELAGHLSHQHPTTWRKLACFTWVNLLELFRFANVFKINEHFAFVPILFLNMKHACNICILNFKYQGIDSRNPVFVACKQKECRQACEYARSDQRLYYSLPEYNY